MKGYRNIVVNGIHYTWKVGRSNVSIRCEEDHYFVAFDELTDESWHTIEHDQWKENFHIGPGLVAKWIRANL